MNFKEMFLGAIITALIDLIVFLTVIGGELFTPGVVIGLLVIFAFSSGVRLMIASARPEVANKETGTDWKSFGSYTLGAAVSTIIAMLLFFI